MVEVGEPWDEREGCQILPTARGHNPRSCASRCLHPPRGGVGPCLHFFTPPRPRTLAVGGRLGGEE